MIIVGWGDKLKILGEAYLSPCANCNNEVVWQVVETSKKMSLYFVPLAKWNKQYFLMCPVCNDAIQLKDKKEAQDLLLEVVEGKTGLLEHILHRLEQEFDREK